MINAEVRKLLQFAGMNIWQLADAVGVSEPTIHRWLRHELPSEKKERLMKAIHDYANEEVNDEQHR